MNILVMLTNPTRNSAWSIASTNVEIVLPALLGILASLQLLALNTYVIACLFFNFLLGYLAGIVAREQFTCEITACLPNHQTALRRHIIVIGLTANCLLMLAALAITQLSWTDKIVMAEIMLLGGLSIFFVLVHITLGLKNLGNLMLVAFPVLIIGGWSLPPVVMSSLQGDLATPLSLMTPWHHLVLVGLFVLSLAWFWRMLGKPKYFRTLMEVSAFGGPGSGSGADQRGRDDWERLQRFQETWWPDSKLMRWIDRIGLPGHGCVLDHLNLQLNRMLKLVVQPSHWVFFAIICIGYPLTLGPEIGGGYFAFGNLCALGLFMAAGPGQTIDTSPLLPYSRTDRVLAMTGSCLLSLLLYLIWFWLAYRTTSVVWILTYGARPASPSELPLPSDLALVFILCAPLVFLARLVDVIPNKNHVMPLFLIWMAINLVAVFAAVRAIVPDAFPVAIRWDTGPYNLVPWFSLSWGLWLLLILLRYKRASLAHQ